MSTLTVGPRWATETQTSEPRSRTTSPANQNTTAKARYALMRQALETAQGKAPEPASSEAQLLDFLKSS